MSEPGDVLDQVFRTERARVLAALIRGLGDFELAEDALSEAAVTALGRWPVDGVPRDPVAWLVTVARRAALDRIRRAGVGAAKYEQVARAAGNGVSAVDELPDLLPDGLARVGDDRLSLLFTCCHPALGPEARVALTLQAVAGLTAAQIARAFLVGKATMAQRLVRAKRKIRDARDPLRGDRTTPRSPTGWPPRSPSSTWSSPRATSPPQGTTCSGADLPPRRSGWASCSPR